MAELRPIKSQNKPFMKKIVTILLALTIVVGGCELAPPVNPNAEHPGFTPVKKYSGDLAVKWNRLQLSISRTTPGFNTGLASRAFAYSGLTLYEAIVGGIPGQKSVASELIGEDITNHHGMPLIYWPASANAAMADALRSFIPTANAANKSKIDSLELAFNEQFKHEARPIVLNNSIVYGKGIAAKIFAWANTDGSAEAAAKNASYIVPVGPGAWQPTPPAFVPIPVNAFISETRTFVKDSPTLTMAPPPPAYSTDPASEFFQHAKYVYDYSLHLTADEIAIVKTWGEFPGNYTQALRYITIAIQLIDEPDLPLDEAATAFAKHNMAIQEAAPCVFASKYKYNLVRPITFIQTVMGYPGWTALNTTPPHPEYPSAHACVGRASSRSLELALGDNYAFTDKTHENLYGTRSYPSLEAYSDEAGWSRVLGGIHYTYSATAGKNQGRQVADLIDGLFGPGI
jgi:hypothetical protein